jgi:hypothetical protein
MFLLWCQLQTFQVPSFIRIKADPKNVASIVLGGGPGVHLFPLTKRAATPAVSKSLSWLTKQASVLELFHYVMILFTFFRYLSVGAIGL